MEIDRYLDVRENFKIIGSKVIEYDDGRGTNMLRAAKKLGFLTGESDLTFENEDEQNVLTDFLFFEKNGLSNRLVDRYTKQFKDDSNDLEKIILDGMMTNYYSLFEVIEIDIDNNTIELSDQLSDYIYTMMDIGLSNTAEIGLLVATRLIPMENIYMSSGLSFAFLGKHRLRLLTEIAKHKRKANRRTSIKIKKKKSNATTLFEIMFKAHKKWGMDIVSLDPYED